MKLFIQIFLIAFVSLSASAQTPDYFGNNPTWSEVYDFEDETEDYAPVDQAFFFSGDTLIDTTEYVTIKNTVEGELDYGMRLLRQEGRTIYA